MHFHDVLGIPGPMTHRQYVTWQEWLELELEHPSRSDLYQMQTTAEIRSVRGMFGKSRPTIKLKDFYLKFGSKKSEEPQYGTAEEAAAASKAKWAVALGIRPEQLPVAQDPSPVKVTPTKNG